MSARAKARGRCVICGGSEDVVRNHVGGRKHVAWFTMPFCQVHHDWFHALVTQAHVCLEYTADERERQLRALKAIKVCEWILLERLQTLNSVAGPERAQPQIPMRLE